MRSLILPGMAPLYWLTQARSDCNARRSPCAIASAGSAGACNAGRIGTVATRFGLAPAADDGFVCAHTGAAAATNIKVAVSIDLITNPGVIDVQAIKHICLVGNNGPRVQLIHG